MKALFLALLAVPSIALSEPIATAPNQGNGKIVLTNELCEVNGKVYSKLSRAYNYISSGQSQEGCYYIEHDMVVVIWSDASTYRYEANRFTLIKKGVSNDKKSYL